MLLQNKQTFTDVFLVMPMLHTHIAIGVQWRFLRIKTGVCHFNDVFKFPGLLFHFSS